MVDGGDAFRRLDINTQWIWYYHYQNKWEPVSKTSEQHRDRERLLTTEAESFQGWKSQTLGIFRRNLFSL